ncbi:hypothetical protein TYRP_011523, partial [Tyrophagus putrescentiae]
TNLVLPRSSSAPLGEERRVQ